ncbi:SDR family NAD(P)-dependent oxidoreductase [Negadavirga shengliensis]|uniref:SDR family NAD(P)-dependent oxidoreductase n=1 Tax=Negadavirga shengliensis TaxID=1389218 RepID=A0ABV9T750_9BACT
MKNLTGKVAFITGGSRGMGAGIAKRLSDAGASVAFTHSGKSEDKAHKVLEAIKSHRGTAMAIKADNEHPDEIIRAMEAGMEAFGPIDILINNAGIFSLKPIGEYGVDEYDQMMKINVKAVFVASQFAAKNMEEGGRIINIGSNMAERVSFPEASLYSMSKSALIGLTKGMARDLGERRITVNLIQPGPVDTDMNPADSDHAASVLTSMAIKRYGKVEEIAGLVAYLCSDEGSFITGTSITIDGGYNI